MKALLYFLLLRQNNILLCSLPEVCVSPIVAPEDQDYVNMIRRNDSTIKAIARLLTCGTMEERSFAQEELRKEGIIVFLDDEHVPGIISPIPKPPTMEQMIVSDAFRVVATPYIEKEPKTTGHQAFYLGAIDKKRKRR